MKSKMTHYNIKYFEKLFVEAGLKLESNILEKLWKFHELLRNANPILNLTRIHNFETIVSKHYIDSLIIVKLLAEASLKIIGPCLDIGTGAGFPGIPLALYFPNLHFILAETRKNRCEFLQDVIQNLNLKNVEVFQASINIPNCPLINTTITRALESVPLTLKRISEGLQVGGYAIFMKGPMCDPEVLEANQNFKNTFELVLDKNYKLNREDQRRLLIWQKKENTMNTKEVEIHSPVNIRFRYLQGLLESRNIKKEGQCLVMGKKIVHELILNYLKYIHSIILPQNFTNDSKINDFKYSKFFQKVNTIKLATNLFQKIDTFGTHYPILLIDLPEIPIWDSNGKNDYSKKNRGPHLNIFLPLSDPENLGAALRICAAYNPDKIILLKESCHPFHPKCIRSSAGHVFSLGLGIIKEEENSDTNIPKNILNNKIFFGPSLSELPNLAYFALDTKGQDINEIDFHNLEEIQLLLGNEGQGLSKINTNLKIKNICITTPTKIESLNATISLALALHIIHKKYF